MAIGPYYMNTTISLLLKLIPNRYYWLSGLLWLNIYYFAELASRPIATAFKNRYSSSFLPTFSISLTSNVNALASDVANGWRKSGTQTLCEVCMCCFSKSL